jgi:hypothetical protein
MYGPTASNTHSFCSAVVTTCIRNSLKIQNRIYAKLLKLHPRRRRETSFSVIPRLQPCDRRTEKEKNTVNAQGILWEDVFL